jgi:hypothetical protein
LSGDIQAQVYNIVNGIILQSVESVVESESFKKAFHKDLEVAVNNVVYSYPAMYPEERRKDNGGLTDINNIKIESSIINNVVNVKIDNNTTGAYAGSGRFVSDVVTTGVGYDWRLPDGTHSMSPRNFMEKVNESDGFKLKFIELLRIELNKYGISLT